jgi:DNA polymerase-3 subunit epsilon
MTQPQIDDLEFVIFDTETTGLTPRSGDRIVELAAMRIRGDLKLDVFESLVNPRRNISAEAYAVNRITPEMLACAPYIEEVLPRFLSFVRNSVLCSYNLGFDLSFLNAELEHAHAIMSEQLAMVDILAMARTLMPQLPRHALWFVAEQLGIHTVQQHRAFSDVEMTWGVFTRFKHMLREKGVVNAKDFLRLFRFRAQAVDDVSAGTAAAIQEAIDSKAAITIKYFSRSRAAVSRRRVIPREIKQEAGYAYLIAFCTARNAERTFRIDHILDIEAK